MKFIGTSNHNVKISLKHVDASKAGDSSKVEEYIENRVLENRVLHEVTGISNCRTKLPVATLTKKKKYFKSLPNKKGLV